MLNLSKKKFSKDCICEFIVSVNDSSEHWIKMQERKQNEHYS